jgi:hypothetical protein
VITAESLGRTRTVVAIPVFVALVVDGMDLQMLALAFARHFRRAAMSDQVQRPVPSSNTH